MSKIKLLVVEDELVISMMICDLLEEPGYKVPQFFTTCIRAVQFLLKKVLRLHEKSDSPN